MIKDYKGKRLSNGWVHGWLPDRTAVCTLSTCAGLYRKLCPGCLLAHYWLPSRRTFPATSSSAPPNCCPPVDDLPPSAPHLPHTFPLAYLYLPHHLVGISFRLTAHLPTVPPTPLLFSSTLPPRLSHTCPSPFPHPSPPNLPTTRRNPHIPTRLTFSSADNSQVARNPGGTAMYLPPEFFIRGARLDKSVDVYSFGMLLWEMYAR